jgi:hypothetical protein
MKLLNMDKFILRRKYKRHRNRFPNFNNWKKWGLDNNFLKSLLKLK